MSVEQHVADALRAAIAAEPAVRSEAHGVFIGRPPRATPPWIEIGDVIAADWSLQDRQGRELRLGATVRDVGPDPARLRRLMDGIVRAAAALPRTLPGWQLGGATFVRSRSGRDGPGWIGAVDLRVRAIED
jgi:hypothetical protein